MRRSVKVFILTKFLGSQNEEVVVGEAYSTYGENRKTERILCGKSEGSRQLRRPRARWENGIKINFKELMWKGGIGKAAQERGKWCSD
jgi:hypothetical protein